MQIFKMFFTEVIPRLRERLVCFLTAWFACRTNRLSFVIGAIVSATGLLVLLLGSYSVPVALSLSAVLFAFVLLTRGKSTRALPVLLWLLGPIVSFISMECMIGNFGFFPHWFSLSWLEIFLNLIWYYMFAGILLLICRRLRLSAIISVIAFAVMGLIDSYFFAFRGRVIFPSDFLATRTALNVIGEYSYMPSLAQICGLLPVVGYIVYAALCMGSARFKIQWKAAAPLLVVGSAYVYIFFFTSFLSWTGFEGKLWTSLWRTRENGVLLNFTVNMRYSVVEKPQGYDTSIGVLTGEYESDNAMQTDDIVKPNVIVIMNESFCDLSVLGAETNEETLPFINSLTENTVKGTTYVSVFGGHTANSEYEFLTGNSISFLPVGTVAYQMFTNAGDYSLVGQLGSMGYYSIAMHPYDKSGWNRVAVYTRYGFDEMYFIDDFKDIENIRDYCSDRSDYENLIDTYERYKNSADGDKPLFLFNVTMQNHGGYTADWRGLDKTVWLTGEQQDQFEAVDMYLSMARESDGAFEMLLSYFRSVDEPTVIVMFGDHQPGLSNSFYQSLFGIEKDALSPEQAVCLYAVPYVIWANYDIPELSAGEFSLNYLSNVLLDVLSFPKTGYQKFLTEAKGVLPVVTRNFYCERGGTFTANPQALSEQANEILHRYSVLQYNGIKGRSNRVNTFFNLQKAS